MILKIVGSIMVIFSAAMVGFYYGNLETLRIRDLVEMKKALAILKSEIEYAKTPLPEALVNIAMRVKNPICNIFTMLEERLQIERDMDITGLWNECINFHAKYAYFSKDDIENFYSFGKTLGYLDKGMQLKNIEMATNYIDEKVETLNYTRAKNKKVFQSFGVLGGILLVIVFV